MWGSYDDKKRSNLNNYLRSSVAPIQESVHALLEKIGVACRRLEDLVQEGDSSSVVNNHSGRIGLCTSRKGETFKGREVQNVAEGPRIRTVQVPYETTQRYTILNNTTSDYLRK